MNRVVAALFAVAGVSFLLYPVMRPYSDETGEDGARAFASSEWLFAHVFAMLAFVVVAVGVLALGSRVAVVTTLVGTAMVLPYYGAETFALHALGIRALSEDDMGRMSLADPIRFGAIQSTMFAVGLLLLAVAGCAVAAHIGLLAVPFAAGLVLFLPQFYAAPPLRTAHGVLMLIGCAAIAYVVLRRDTASAGLE